MSVRKGEAQASEGRDSNLYWGGSGMGTYPGFFSIIGLF